MGFQFQINSDVVFNHNKNLLEKADRFRPILYKKQSIAQDIVEIVSDDSKLEGVGVKKINDAKYLSDIKMTRDNRIILDFGQHYVGKFSIHIDHVGSPMDAPLYFKLKFSEMPNELAHSSEQYDGWLSKSWIQEEAVHLDKLPATLELPRRYSFRYVEIQVIDTSPKWHAIFSNPTVITQSSADTANAEKWESNDAELLDIYDVGLATLFDCMQDVFEDGPKRDRRLWLGDLRLQALANYETFNNTDLVKRCLYLFGSMAAEDGRISANVFTDPNYIPDDTFMYDYSLFFISILDDLEKHGFNQELLDDLYPIAKKQWTYITQFIDEQGKVILDDNYTVFVDWSNKFNKETSAQAITIYTLKQLIHLAKLVKDKDIINLEHILYKLEDYTKNNLYDFEQHLFVSGHEKEVNISSQVWMVLAHVMDDETNLVIMKQALQKLFPITGIATPYMYHHIVQSLFEAGLSKEAVQLMKDYWGKMISLGADTYWEAFDPNIPDYSPYGSPIVNSYCHAWSCTPVYLLKKYLK